MSSPSADQAWAKEAEASARAHTSAASTADPESWAGRAAAASRAFALQAASITAPDAAATTTSSNLVDNGLAMAKAMHSFYNAGTQGRLWNKDVPATIEASSTATPAAAASASASSSSKRPADESDSTSPVAKKQKKPAVRVELLAQIKEEAIVAAKWFAKFCYTRHMIETLAMTPSIDGDEDLFAELYGEYRESTEVRHEEWTEKNNARDADSKRAEESEPSKVMSQWAWEFMTGPLSYENEFIEPFSAETLKKIITAHEETFTREDDTVDDERDIEAILENEHEAADMSHEYHPVGMLLGGVVTRSNAPWLSDEDLTKIARAHGSVSLTRAEMLNDIYRSQVLHCQEIVAAGVDMGEEARGYCAARGVLEDSKKALNLRVLREERPDRNDRNKRIPHSKNGLDGFECMQCGYIFGGEDAGVKDKYPQHLLDAVCTACSALPIA